jgi:hypothetical protein
MLTPIRNLWEQFTGVASWPERQILTLLNANGIASLPHSGNRTLYDHLTATRKVLHAWDQPPEIQLAGLCHSIYSTEAYHHQAVPLSERSKVQRIIGIRAERLAFLFSAVLRLSLFGSLRKAESLRQADRIEIDVRSEAGCEDRFISGEEAAQLLILHLANMAEQSCENGGRPGIWLSRFSRLARNLQKSDQLAPALFSGASATISEQQETELRDAYTIAIMNSESAPDVAWAQLNQCIQLCPYVAEPFIWKAYLARERGDDKNRVGCARQALDVLPKWGTVWDKRLDYSAWKEAAQSLSAGKLAQPLQDQLLQIVRSERSAGLIAQTKENGANGGVVNAQGLQRFFQYLNRISLEKSTASVKVYPGLSSKEFHAAQDFSVVPELEASFDAIASEVGLLGDRGFHHEAERIKRTGDWKVLMLYEGGRKNEENCARCPTLVRIIEEHACVRKSGGLIYLSRLAPGTEVAPHRGPTNIRLRCHLAIKVPEGECGMRVGRRLAKWEKGKCIVFDDHYEHEVWNRTNEERIVLLVDLWHPDLTLEERNALDALYWYSYRHALGLVRYWKNNEQQILREGGETSLINEMSKTSHETEEIGYLDH